MAERRQSPRASVRESRFDRLLEVLSGTSTLALPGDLVPLRLFALAVDRSERTIANDLTSSDIARRLDWPAFRKARGGWVTTTEEIRSWYAGRRSTHPDAAVLRRLKQVRRVG